MILNYYSYETDEIFPYCTIVHRPDFVNDSPVFTPALKLTV